jgi:integrase
LLPRCYPEKNKGAKVTKQLTVRTIENLKPSAERHEVPDGLIPGLTLVIQPTGAKSWALRYRLSGKQKKLTIGSHPAVNLKSARDLARTALVAVAKGEDPAQEKQETKRKERAGAIGDLIEKVVPAFIERHSKKKNREAHIRETERILRLEVVSHWEGRRLSDITRADVHGLLDSIVDRPAPILANRTLAAIRKLSNWALERGLINASPCTGIRAPAGEKSRDRVLRDEEIKVAWAAFEAAGWPFGPLAKLLLLTGARRDEVSCMTWDEVDLKARLWIIPAARCKNGQEHQIPLSDPAAAILGGLPRIIAGDGPGFVFTTTGRTPISGFSKAKKQFDKLIAESRGGEPIPAWTLHDLRRTCASSMAALGTPPHVCDAVLNHKSGSIKGVAAVYNRYAYAAEKRAALETWGWHLAAQTGAPTGRKP